MKISLYQILLATICFSLAEASHVAGQGILDKKISVNLERETLREVLILIEKKAEVKFLFHSQIVPVNEVLTIRANNETLAEVLNEILSSRQINYEVDGNQIILTKPGKDVGLTTEIPKVLPINAIVVGGVVKDETGQPIPGASVMEKGTSNGTTTDNEGRYMLSVNDANSTLVFSFIGFSIQEIAMDGQLEINVSLTPDITSLSEVVVVGYGTQKKSDVIASIATVNGEELNVRSTPNFEASLQGLAAGVNVQSSSGSPGAPVKILIRGANSLNLGTDPLYIIDGMPVTGGSSGLGSSNLSPMSLINASDIENISVLKDAGATAIYGSRASNGVILITTKSAKKGESAVQLNYSSGVSSLIRNAQDVGFSDTKQWFNIMDAAYQNDPNRKGPFKMSDYYTNVPLSMTPFSSPLLTRDQAESINTNWYDKLFSTGTFQNVNLAASQGTDNTSFYLSGNYYKNNGVQDHVKLERFTIRANLDFKPTKNLTISPKLTFSYTKNDQRASGITSLSTYALPWLPVFELDNPNRYFNAYTGNNPVALNDPSKTLNRVEQYRALGGIALDYKLPFLKGLSLKGSFGGDIQQSNKALWASSDIQLSSDNNPQSSASNEIITSNVINYNAYIDYNRKINEHAFNVTGGVEATRTFQYLTTAAGYNLVGNYQELGTPGTISGASGQKGGERYIIGYFGRANYKYKERYFLEASFRRDGSSAFTPQNRWGNFAGVSAGWLLSEERFMSFLNGNTLLKIRGSFGQVGNQYLPNGLSSSLYNTANNPTLTYGSNGIQGNNGTIPINIATGNLKWETTNSSDVGLDFGLFKNRLNGSFAYYRRNVSNMLLQAGLPFSAGVSSQLNLQVGNGSYDQVSSIWGNFGSLVNSGFELELHSVNFDHNGFKWTTDFNSSLNNQVIKKLSPDIDSGGKGLTNNFQNQVSKKGQRRGVWFIADYAGVDAVTGDGKIYARDQEAYAKDGTTQRLKNGKGEDVLLDANNTNVQANQFFQHNRSADPRYQGGITNTLQYGNFDFSFMVSFQGGNYILDYDRNQATVPYPTHVILSEVYDNSWKAPGDIAKYPRLQANRPAFSGQSSYNNSYLYKGDFIRLRNVQLGYRLSNKITQRMSIKSARIYISGSNLYTLTKYPGFDPETAAVGFPVNGGSPATPGFVYYSGAIPQLKTFTLGVDLKF